MNTKNNTLTQEVVDEWWSNADFNLMSKVAGLQPYQFSSEDGYQDFVDACNKWWNNLSFGDKLYYYFENN